MPRNPREMYEEALRLAQNNRAQEACVLCEKLIDTTKSNLIYWLLHIAILEHLGRYSDVENCINSAIQNFPTASKLYLKLGEIKRNNGDFFGAEKSFKYAISLNKNDSEAIHELAGIYKINNRLDEAVVLFLQCLELKPNYPAALFNLAIVYYEKKELDKALSLLNRCLNISPNSQLANAWKAITLERLGSIKEAKSTILLCISTHRTVPVATGYSSVAAHFNDMIPGAIEYIKLVIKTTSSSREEKASLYFSLGNMYEKSYDYDNAFKHYKHGNQLRNHSFNITHHIEFIERIKKSFLTYKPLPKNKTTKKRKIFIVGMPRSGTSLVEQILDSHPDCFGAGELPHISIIANTPHKFIPGQLIYPDFIPLLDEISIEKLANEYSKRAGKLTEKSLVVVDKMPVNYLYVGLISAMYPDAIILNCTRNPLDNCISCFFTDFGERHPYTSNLEVLADYYKSYADLMKFWRQYLNIPILDINYESLVKNQESVTRELLEFCDLDWNKSCMNFHKNSRNVNTASYNQVRRPIYSKSINRWKHFENHLGKLCKRLRISS